MKSPSSASLPPLVWWVIWGSVLLAQGVFYVALGRGPTPPAVAAELFKNLAGVVPLFLSIILRWLVLPRYLAPERGIGVFIAGLALAEAGGLLGLLLGGPYRGDLFALAVLCIVQYVPLLLRRSTEPRGSGFIPNN